MKIPLDQALEITQLIVPEIDLKVQKKDDGHLEIFAVPMNYWNLYINAMENASDVLLEDLQKLPDVPPYVEIEAIAQDINCLITSFNMFYMCTMEEIARHLKPVQIKMNRYDRYKKRGEEDGG